MYIALIVISLFLKFICIDAIISSLWFFGNINNLSLTTPFYRVIQLRLEFSSYDVVHPVYSSTHFGTSALPL